MTRPHVLVISAQIRDHVDQAFDRALLISLTIGVAAAVLTALTISWLVAGRLAAGVRDVAGPPAGWPTATTARSCPIPGWGPSSAPWPDR